MTDFLFDVIATELEDAVGRENCSTRTIDKIAHSVDYFWLLSVTEKICLCTVLPLAEALRQK